MAEINEIVYIYGFTGRNSEKMANFISLLEEQIKLRAKINVILIHDGVIGTSKKGIIPKSMEQLLNLPIKIYGMKPDILARGISPDDIDNRIKLLEYGNLVDILVRVPKIASWM
jgi:sulfur relay protein TusB/DsrH